jgi:hypothetical protein
VARLKVLKNLLKVNHIIGSKRTMVGRMDIGVSIL